MLHLDEASGNQIKGVSSQSQSLETVGSGIQVLIHEPNIRTNFSSSQSIENSHK